MSRPSRGDLGVTVDRFPEIALRFCLSQSATSTVIAGMRSLRNVDAKSVRPSLAPCRPRSSKSFAATAG